MCARFPITFEEQAWWHQRFCSVCVRGAQSNFVWSAVVQSASQAHNNSLTLMHTRNHLGELTKQINPHLNRKKPQEQIKQILHFWTPCSYWPYSYFPVMSHCLVDSWSISSWRDQRRHVPTFLWRELDGDDVNLSVGNPHTFSVWLFRDVYGCPNRGNRETMRRFSSRTKSCYWNWQITPKSNQQFNALTMGWNDVPSRWSMCLVACHWTRVVKLTIATIANTSRGAAVVEQQSFCRTLAPRSSIALFTSLPSVWV